MMYLRLCFIGFFAAIMAGCQNDPKSADNQSPKQLKVDTLEMPVRTREGAGTYDITEGTITWIGKNGQQLYAANVPFKGELLANQDYLLSGTLELDMTGLALIGDQPSGEEKAKLEQAIKSASYLNTAKYPTARLEFSEVLPSKMEAFNAVLEALLTMKGKTLPVNVPLKVTVGPETCTLESVNFGVNATDWGMALPGKKGMPADEGGNLTWTLTAKARRR